MSAARKPYVISSHVEETLLVQKSRCPCSLVWPCLLLFLFVCVSVSGYLYCLQLQINNLSRTTMVRHNMLDEELQQLLQINNLSRTAVHRSQLEEELQQLRQHVKRLETELDKLTNDSKVVAEGFDNDIRKLKSHISNSNKTGRRPTAPLFQGLGLEESETAEFKPMVGTMLNIEEFPDMTDAYDDNESPASEDDDEEYVEYDGEPGKPKEETPNKSTFFDNRHPPTSDFTKSNYTVMSTGSPLANISTSVNGQPSISTDAVSGHPYVAQFSVNSTTPENESHTSVNNHTSAIVTTIADELSMISKNKSEPRTASIVSSIPIPAAINPKPTSRNVSAENESGLVQPVPSRRGSQGPRLFKRHAEISSSDLLNAHRNESTAITDASAQGNRSFRPPMGGNNSATATGCVGNQCTAAQSIRYNASPAISGNQTRIATHPVTVTSAAKKIKTKTKRGQVSGNTLDAYEYPGPPAFQDYQSNLDILRRRDNFRELDDNVDDAETITEIINAGRNHKEINVVVAAHFGADSSPYSVRSHPNTYKGNGRLCHPTGEYKDWKASDWHDKYEMHNHVTLSDGNISIRTKGLYFVYAQIFYSDHNDVNGYKIMRNSDAVLQCITSSYSPNSSTTLKSNTCFTGGVVHCSAGDTLSIKTYDSNRHVLLEPSRSFFGVFKLGESQIPQ